MKKEKKTAVFISSGIGNAVMLVPLLRLLRNDPANHISIILTSKFVDREFLIFNNFPFDEIISFNGNYFSFIKHFDIAYLDYSSSSIKNLLIASLISKKSYAYRKNKLPVPTINYLPPVPDMHAVVLNAGMADKSINEKKFYLDLMRLKPGKKALKEFNSLQKDGLKTISVQISSGNNRTKYKDWPLEYWIDFLSKLIAKYPEFQIVLLGDQNEVHLGNRILQKIQNNRIISLIGKTSLKEAAAVLYNSDFYLGLDSGFMHLAVAYGIPVFTILGASSEQFIGYHKFDAGKFIYIYKDIPCRSCHAWIGANTSRVSNPDNCPDFQCLTRLKPDEVFEKFERFITR